MFKELIFAPHTELRASLSAKDGELSDTKIRLDELQTAAGREAATREEMGHHYQHRMREKQAELQAYRAYVNQGWSVTGVCLLFYAIATVFQLYHGGDMLYEIRRKTKPTLDLAT